MSFFYLPYTSGTETINTSSGIDLFDGDAFDVSSGGSAFATTVNSGASFTVDGSGASAFDTTVLNGGVEDVYDGGVDSGASVSSGGLLSADPGSSGTSGGAVDNATVYSGGEVDVNGVGTGITVSDGGLVSVGDGGVSQDTQVASGGTELVDFNGSSDGTVVSSGGFQVLLQETPGESLSAIAGGILESLTDIGGVLTLVSAAITDTFTSNSDGSLTVTASSTDTGQYESGTVDSGLFYSGFLDEFGGATANNTTVLAGGTLQVDGGAAPGLTVEPGGFIVVGGSFNVGLDGNDNPTVASVTGVTEDGITVTSGVELDVTSGNFTSNTVVQKGGAELLEQGAREDLFVSNYTNHVPGAVLVSGHYFVQSGGKAGGLEVASGGVVVVSSGGAAIDTKVAKGGIEVVSAGGLEAVLTTNYATLGAPGEVDVSGDLQVSAGAAVDEVNVFESGVVFVSSGGTAFNTRVNSGASEVISSGGAEVLSGDGNYADPAHTGQVFVGGTFQVEAGGTARGLLVQSGGSAFVSSGGEADDTSVASGGVELIQSGGQELLSGDNSTSDEPGTVFVDGAFFVGSGGHAFGLSVGSGGQAVVSSGGVAFDTVVSSGGIEFIFAGGTEALTTSNYSDMNKPGQVEVLGEFQVQAKGVAEGLFVSSGGQLFVSSGGVAENTVLQTGGTEVILLGGEEGLATNDHDGNDGLSGTVQDSGLLAVVSGGTATGVEVLSGGFLYISSGGSGFDTAVEQGGTEIVSSGGTERLDGNNSLANGDTGATGVGQVIVGSGGTVDVGSGASRATAGLAYGLDVHADGLLQIFQGGVTIGAQIETSGSFDIGYRSTASGTVDRGGQITVEADGESDGAVITQATGVQYVTGSASGSTVSAMGTEIVQNGGVTELTTLGAGGQQDVQAGGTATGTIVQNGALAFVNGGSAADLTVQAGGFATIAAGGTVTGLTVNAGGTVSASGQLAGPIQVDGVLSAVGSLRITGMLTGGGTLVVTPGANVQGLGGAQIANIKVQTAGTLGVGGPAYNTDPITVDSGGVISGTGIIGGAITDNGVIEALGGSLVLTGAVTGTGALEVGAGASLTLDGSVTAGTTVTFEGAAGTLYLADSAAFMGTIVNQSAGNVVACYCHGTRILTPRGEVAIEQLAIGDHVVTAAGGSEPIRWLGRRSYAGRFLSGRAHLMPILFRAGSLGGGLPHRDLRVSPAHAMFLDGVLIPAACLVNGSSIVQDRDCTRVDYIHVELAGHDIILAEGAASETFLDDDSRGVFNNAWEYADLYPAAPAPAAFCAPRIEAGYRIEAVRQRLARIAADLAAPPVGRNRLTG